MESVRDRAGRKTKSGLENPALPTCPAPHLPVHPVRVGPPLLEPPLVLRLRRRAPGDGQNRRRHRRRRRKPPQKAVRGPWTPLEGQGGGVGRVLGTKPLLRPLTGFHGYFHAATSSASRGPANPRAKMTPIISPTIHNAALTPARPFADKPPLPSDSTAPLPSSRAASQLLQ